ncbi:MAG: peptidoglycan DD-metalloendopeptidase family protein [Candidatus Micrarchaeota archaeon]
MLEESIELTEKVDGDYIDLLISSQTGTISGAQIYLFELEGKQLPKKLISSADGKASILVKQGNEYYITAYASGYLPASITASASTQQQKIMLEKQNDENSADLEITVLEDGEPSESAEVALFKSDGYFLGMPAGSTDFDGKVTFRIPREIEGSSYKLLATASREASVGRSAIISSEGVENLLINLVSAPANMDVVLVDAITKAKLTAGKVTAQTDAGDMLGECEIAEWRCAISNIPSNIEFYLVGLSPKYLKTTSDHYILSPKEFRQMQLNLVSEKDATSVSAAFIGIFKSGEEVKELGNGETYYAKFIVTFPSAAEIAGFHAHISPTNGILKLLEIDSAAQSLFTSSRYSPDTCYSTTDGNGTINSVDLVFPRGTAGTKEIAIKFSVSHDATASSPVTFFYKAYSEKKGVVISYPESEDLLVEDSVEPLDLVRRMCANGNKEVQIKVTDSPLICNADGSFCRRITLKASSTDIPLGTEFTVNFEVLSEEPIISLSVINSNLELASATAGTGLADEPSVTQQAGEQSADIAIPSNIRTSGSIKLKAIKAGTTELLLAFKSENHVYSYRQNLRISGENIMRAAISPSQFNVGEEKRPRVSVYDSSDNPITDAIVMLYDCDRAPLSAEDLQLAGTNERGMGLDGIYQFSLTPATTGKIGLKVFHPKYRTIDRCDLNVEITDDALRVSPQSLQFIGDSSSTIEERSISITSSFTDKSDLSIISTCGNQETPVLYAFPNYVQNFKGSSEIKIGVLPDVSATTNCQLIFEQAITSRSTIRTSIPVRVNVKSSRVSDLESNDFAALPSVINLRLDENGFADVMYSGGNIGEISFCDIQAKDDFLVTADCTGSLVHISADYSAESLNKTFRQRGKLQIRTSDQQLRTFSIIVTAPDAPTLDASTKIIRYNNLPVLPNPVTFYLDPYTRRFDNFYSLGVFEEPVIGCSIQDAEFGITTEFCGPEEQRIHVVADFTGNDVYNRLLQRIYGSNPACMLYFQQQGGYYGSGYSNQYSGYSQYGSSAYSPYSQYGASPYQSYSQYGSSPYQQYSYSSIDQTGFGSYPVPQYRNGYVGYQNYPQMNSLQSPYPYPQPYYGQNNLMYDYSLSQIYANPTIDSGYSWDRCNAASFDVPLLITLRSGRTRTVPIRIMARGMPRTQQQRFQTSNNEEWESQEIQLDPYTLTRYAAYDVPLGQQSNLGFPQCKVATDSSFFKQVTENTQISAGQQYVPSKIGKLAPAFKMDKCSESSGVFKVEGFADGSGIAASSRSASGALNDKSDLYLDIYYPAGVHKLAPIILKLGEVSEYTLEPISSNLQFIVTDAKPSFEAEFKDTNSIFTEGTCAISGFENAAADTGLLGDFRSKVMIQAGFEKEKYSLGDDGTYAKAEKDAQNAVSLATVPETAGTISCKAKKSDVSAKLWVASFRGSYEYDLDGLAFSTSISPEMGKLMADAGKSIACEVTSQSFSNSFKNNAQGNAKCTLENGAIQASVDYGSILTGEEKGSIEKNGLKDTLTLKLSSVTDNPKSRLKQKQISRPLADIRLIMNKKGVEEAYAIIDNYRYSLSTPLDSVCFLADRQNRQHQGIDIVGTPDADGKARVYAPFAGEVVSARMREDCYGNTVIMRHSVAGEPDFYTLYGHLAEINVRIGDKLSKGSIVGVMGNSKGKDCNEEIGLHLHFQTCSQYDVSADFLSECFHPCAKGICPDAPNGITPYGCNVCSNTNPLGGPDDSEFCRNRNVAPDASATIPQAPDVTRETCEKLIEGSDKTIGIVLNLDDSKKLRVADICINPQAGIAAGQREFALNEKIPIRYSVPADYTRAAGARDYLVIYLQNKDTDKVLDPEKIEISISGGAHEIAGPASPATYLLIAGVNDAGQVLWDGDEGKPFGSLTFGVFDPEDMKTNLFSITSCKLAGFSTWIDSGVEFKLKFNKPLAEADRQIEAAGKKESITFGVKTYCLNDPDPTDSRNNEKIWGNQLDLLKQGKEISLPLYYNWEQEDVDKCKDKIYVKLISYPVNYLPEEQSSLVPCS